MCICVVGSIWKATRLLMALRTEKNPSTNKYSPDIEMGYLRKVSGTECASRGFNLWVSTRKLLWNKVTIAGVGLIL